MNVVRVCSMLMVLALLSGAFVLLGQEQTQPGAGNNPIALGDPAIYDKSLKALTMLFVVAVLLESAFSLLFSWKVFLSYVSLAGLKTPIMFLTSWAVVSQWKLDVVASLTGLYTTGKVESTVFSSLLTAMILAGGSSGVNRLLAALGFRKLPTPADTPKPPADKAWVAVRVIRKESEGPAFVTVKELGAPVATSPAPIAGTVGIGRPKLKELLLRNPNRFPPNGGHTVTPGVVYEIAVKGKRADGTEMTGLGGQYVFAPAAIVDIEVTL